MHPAVYGEHIRGGVPGLHLSLQSRKKELFQDVLQDPAGKERGPHPQEVDDRVALSRRPGGEGATKLGHPHLPHQPVIGVHTGVGGGGGGTVFISTYIMKLV